MYEYESLQRLSYDCKENGEAVFVPVCESCGRFVKANPTIKTNYEEGLIDEPNAMCSKCGPTKMPFEGFF